MNDVKDPLKKYSLMLISAYIPIYNIYHDIFLILNSDVAMHFNRILVFHFLTRVVSLFASVIIPYKTTELYKKLLNVINVKDS